MTLGTVTPGPDDFAARTSEQAVVPVVRRLLADGETPVGVYRKLAGGRPGTFLLESAEQGRQWSRYSFVGVRSAGTLTERDGRAVWLGDDDGPGGAPELPDDPLEAFVALSRRLRSPRPDGLPPLTGGLVGYLSYDTVRRMERLPSTAVDDIGMPELSMMLVTDLAVLDHADGTVLLIANVVRGLTDPSYDAAVARLDAMTAALAEPAPPSVATVDLTADPEVLRRTTPDDHMARVETVKEHIRAGDAFQVVLSQRFEMRTDVDALDVYRVLRATNPSPYMYLLRFAGRETPFDVVGSSPEALVTVTSGDGTDGPDGAAPPGKAVLHPIAGTRPRGATPEDDTRLAAELLADPKERSEHVMLVDLGRNDLGRVCTPGSVDVVDFMQIERYSHVMHIVSTVVGALQPGKDALDVLVATFPAGTLSGAPKPRAMEIIESLEPTRRALYGGTVGYVDATGDMDMAIAIRTAVLHDGTAYVQAGGGLVADSDPAAEQAECENKAAAVLRAVAAAQTLRGAG
jgi:anthranilate synthase component I